MSDLITITRARQAPQLAQLDPSLLGSLIAAASARIVRYCRREFVADERNETHDGDGTNSLFLRCFPVQEIDSLTITLPDGQIETYDGDELIVNTRTGEVRFGPDAGRSLFPRGFQIIAVTVTAGFDPVPADVQEAAVQLCCFLAASLAKDPTASSERLGDYQVSYAAGGNELDGQDGLPAAVRQLLAPYRVLGV